MFSEVLFAITTIAVIVDAQSNTVASPATTPVVPTISPCIQACIQPAVMRNGCSFVDLECLCVSSQFGADISACFMEHCSPTDLANAVALRNATCDAAGLTASWSATAKPVSSTLASSAANASATSSVSKAAAESVLAKGAGTFLGALLAAVLAL